jgi:hypothetical protein
MAAAWKAALLAVLAMRATASTLTADLKSLDSGSDKEWKEKPITKVVNLLKDMKAQLETEAANDAELYDKLVCWCETNDKEKTKAIADGEQKAKELTSAIEEAKALASTRETEIGQLNADVADLTKALDEAAAIRAKENGEFTAQEKDLTASITSLAGAVTQLGNAHGGASLLQRQQKSLLQVAHALKRHTALAEDAVAPHLRPQVRELLRAPSHAISLLQQPVAAQSYAPQSGAIFGILKQMKETFETNLETGKQEESKAVSDYQNLKSTKEAQVKGAKDKIFTKTEELAKAKENAVIAKSDLDLTEKTLAADTEFLAKLRDQCETIDKQWEERSKMRSEEIAAVGETIGILTDDAARDQFSSAGQFVQLRAQSKLETAARERTVAFLVEAGKKLNSPRVSFLAQRLRLDVFAKVKENIDGMVGVLGEEQTAEQGKNGNCISDETTNEKQQKAKHEHKDDVETEINTLQTEIKEKQEEEARLKAEIFDAQIELKAAGTNRELENKDFQTIVGDQRATVEILKRAKDRLAEFYNRKAALLQRRGGQTPPGAFKEYKKNAGGGQGGAMFLLESIIKECKDTEEDATHAENSAQEGYEEYVKETNNIIKTMQDQIIADEAIEAKDAKKEAEDEGDKRTTINDIDNLEDMSDTLHGECDFTVNNFGERQGKRADEIEALKQSKAIFSGMK